MDKKMEYFISMLNMIEPYYILIIVIVGFLGNTYSFLKFISSKLENQSASFFLASLFFVDNGFLVSILVITLRHFRLDWFNTSNLICKSTVYFTYVFAFLSVWNIVALSVERFILLFVPFQKLTLKKKRRNHLTLLFLVSFSMIFYSFAIFTTNNSDSNRCQPIEEWFNFVKIMSLIDSILTIILPFLLVLIINLAIIIKMVKYKKSKDLTEGLNQTTKETAIELVTMDKAKVGKEMSLFKNRNYILDKKPLSAANAAADDMISALPRQKSESLTLNLNEINNQIRNGSFNSKIEIIRRKRVYWRMTNILLAITTSFLILNFPFCFLKLRYFIRGFSSITIKPHIQYTTNVTVSYINGTTPNLLQNLHITNSISSSSGSISSTIRSKNSASSSNNNFKEHMDASIIDELIERVTYYIYYLNFSINFILFAFSVSKSKLKIKLSKLYCY